MSARSPGTDGVTSDDDGSTITATFVVELPFGAEQTGEPQQNAHVTHGLVAQLDALGSR